MIGFSAQIVVLLGTRIWKDMLALVSQKDVIYIVELMM